MIWSWTVILNSINRSTFKIKVWVAHKVYSFLRFINYSLSVSAILIVQLSPLPPTYTFYNEKISVNISNYYCIFLTISSLCSYHAYMLLHKAKIILSSKWCHNWHILNLIIQIPCPSWREKGNVIIIFNLILRTVWYSPFFMYIGFVFVDVGVLSVEVA